MRRRGSDPLQNLLLVSFIILQTGFTAQSAHASTAPSVILYSNDVHGEIEPCGCRGNPKGGVARKSEMMRRLGLKSTDVIHLDAGDLLFDTRDIPEGLKAQNRLQASTLLKTFSLMGETVVTPGEKDFALGLDELRKFSKQESNVHFVSANLYSGKRRIFEPYRLIQTKNAASGKTLRAAIIGISSPELPWPEGISAKPPVPELKSLLGSIRSKSDLIVILSHQGLPADLKLASDLKGVDAIIGGHTQSYLQEPDRSSGIPIFQTAYQNQFIGVLPIEAPFNLSKHQMIALDEGYEPKEPDEMTSLVEAFKLQVQELNVKLTRNSTVAAKESHFQTFPRCAECHLKQFDFWRKTAHISALKPLVSARQTGNKECLSCHTVGMDQKGGFSDISRLGENSAGNSIPPADLSHALEVIRNAERLSSSVSLKLRQDKLPLRESLSQIKHAWAPVQCENCHGAGGEHPFSDKAFVKIKKEACLSCHTSERAPLWYTETKEPDWTKIEAKLKKVACPSGELE